MPSYTSVARADAQAGLLDRLTRRVLTGVTHLVTLVRRARPRIERVAKPAQHHAQLGVAVMMRASVATMMMRASVAVVMMRASVATMMVRAGITAVMRASITRANAQARLRDRLASRVLTGVAHLVTLVRRTRSRIERVTKPAQHRA